ncbi:MAG: hypothetical protein WD513_01700 [Balneolaceae bacterium]
MSDRENRSLAYLYDEMDPAEKLEFERDLEIDSNLLIEVESLKKVSERLQELKPVDPPKEVVDALYSKLNQNKLRRDNYKPGKLFIYSAAAVIILGLTTGLLLMDGNESTNLDGADSAVVGGDQFIYQTTGNQNSMNVEKVTPWVDHNEVIHFQDGYYTGSESASIDSIYRLSLEKLTPVTNPMQSATARQNLQLTGSRR